MVLKSDFNPLMYVIFNKVKSAWIRVPMVTSSVMTAVLWMGLVSLDIINIGQAAVSWGICLGSPSTVTRPYIYWTFLWDAWTIFWWMYIYVIVFITWLPFLSETAIFYEDVHLFYLLCFNHMTWVVFINFSFKKSRLFWKVVAL